MPTLPEHLSALMQPTAYPHPVQAIELIETHVSWVLLAGEWAYKIKRPVVFPFVDLRSPERRAFYCHEEVRLNRRFAPQLYIEVCEIRQTPQGARIGGVGPVIDHVVKMVQFSPAEGLDRFLAANAIDVRELEQFGHELGALHGKLPAATDREKWGTADAVRHKVLENWEQCEQAARIFGPAALDQALRQQLERLLEEDAEQLKLRRKTGFVRECHGDLHVRNIARYDSKLVAFDCMEFEPAFRWIDVAEEIAFLWMDLCHRGCEMYAQAFLNGYLAQTGDYSACRLIRFYAAHCALVRAKVAALTVTDSDETVEIEAARSKLVRYVQTARASLASDSPRLILMSGVSGSGKTWLARQIAPRLNAIHLRSDIERKRGPGMSPHTRSHSTLAGGLYTPEATQVVYTRLAEQAASALTGGFTVIVDATILQQQDRKRFFSLASALQVKPWFILCEAPQAVLQSRIAQRAAKGEDPSEADLSILQWQQAHTDALRPDEPFETRRVDTTQTDAVEHLLSQLR